MVGLMGGVTTCREGGQGSVVRRLTLSAVSHAASPAAAPAQNQKAFQKQDQIFVGKKRVLGKKFSIRDTRYFKNVGLGIKTPRTAIEGTYVDKKCPWTGTLLHRYAAGGPGRCTHIGREDRTQRRPHVVGYWDGAVTAAAEARRLLLLLSMLRFRKPSADDLGSSGSVHYRAASRNCRLSCRTAVAQRAGGVGRLVLTRVAVLVRLPSRCFAVSLRPSRLLWSQAASTSAAS